MASKKVTRQISIFINGKEVKNQLGAVGKEIGKTRGQLKHLTRGTAEYIKKSAELQKLKKVYAGMKKEIEGTAKATSSLGKHLKGVLFPVSGAILFTDFLKRIISSAKDFVFESVAMAQRAKGIERAFADLGEEGESAFDRIKTASRGLLSNLEIKKSLVEFNNFGISLESTADLFEFLTLRATQTGESIDHLKKSLVEGLSKESKLRIDNLGISTAALNAELERTPDFVQAVANIAKSEITKAGDIIDKAANTSDQWNASLQNMQLRIGKLINGSGIVPFFQKVGIAIFDTIATSKSLTEEFELQRDKVLDLNDELIPLIDEYDALKEKSKLSKEEQERLKTVIGQIAKITPTAVTEFDKYGVAMDISSDKAREFIQTQEDLLKFRNKELIEEQTDALKGYEDQIESLTKKLNNRNADGNLFKTEAEVFTKQVRYVDRVLSGEEIQELQDRLARAQQMVRGANESIEQLSGDFLQKHLDREKERTAQLLKEARAQADALGLPYSEETTTREIQAAIKKYNSLEGERKKASEKSIAAQKRDQEKLLNEIEKIEEQTALAKLSNEEREIQQIENKYAKLLELARAGSEQEKRLLELKDTEILNKRKALEEKFQLEKKAIQDKFLAQSTEGKETIELVALKEFYDKSLLSEEEYQIQKKFIEDKYALIKKEEADAEAEADAEKQAEGLELILANDELNDEERYRLQKERLDQLLRDELISQQEYEKEVTKLKGQQVQIRFQQALQGLNAIDGIVQKAKQSELDNIKEVTRQKGESEEEFVKRKEAAEKQKKDINKKYAGIELLITVGKTIASTALGIMRAYSDLGPIAGSIFAGIVGTVGAIEIGLAKKQHDKIKSYNTGGPTGFGDLGYGSNAGGHIRGVVEEGEYVIPRFIAMDHTDPVASTAMQYLEAKRTGTSFMEGGPAGDTPAALDESTTTTASGATNLEPLFIRLINLLENPPASIAYLDNEQAEAIAQRNEEVKQARNGAITGI